MKRGRPKKPTALKVLDGTINKRPQVDAFEAEGVPIKPPGLTPAASWLWDWVVPELAAKGVACRADTPMLTAMVVWYGKFHAALQSTEADGGDPLDYRAINIAATSWKQCDNIARRFGLTPSDRASLQVAPKEQKSPLSEFLNRGKCLTN